MCLSPKVPKPPEPPPPPPAPVISSTQPTTVKPTMSKRASLRQASQGTSSLNIPLGGSSGGGSVSSSLSNLSIGK
jgi:hypothetical protein